MNKQLSTFLSTVILIAVAIFSGIGLHRTVTEYWNLPTLISVETSTERQAIPNIPLTPQETAEFITGPLTANTGELCVFKLNREERKDRFHRNYLQRKTSGAQKRYEDKIKAEKKAEMDAKKNALRAEDISKGVFVPVSNLPKQEPRIAGREKAALPMAANQ